MVRRSFALLTTLLAAGLLSATAFASTHEAIVPVFGAPEALVAALPHPAAASAGNVLNPLPDLAPVPQGRMHEVRLDVLHRFIEVAPGVKFEAWTFGGTLPGPTVHIRQGDTVDFTMTNRAGETAKITPPLPHSIDFHAAQVNPMDKYRSIAPGETIHFRWTANYPGVFMYHCGTPMLLHHMCMGMYGAVVVDPAGGYPDKADREYVIVQSQLFTMPEDAQHPDVLTGNIEAALKNEPTYVVFNGRANQYQDRPLKARAGERVRLYVLNAGPCGTSSFHVVGTILDKVYLDGNPQNLLHGMQTVLLPSAGAAVVEFTIPEPGKYPFVDHQFNNASLGAIGVIDATDGHAEAAGTNPVAAEGGGSCPAVPSGATKPAGDGACHMHS